MLSRSTVTERKIDCQELDFKRELKLAPRVE